MSGEIFVLSLIAIPLVYSLVRHFINLHYKSKGIDFQKKNKLDLKTFDEIYRETQKMEQRIVTLEHILDQDVPGWRRSSQHES